MDDLGFIVASYVVTFVGVASFAWSIVRRTRRQAKHVRPEDRPWT